VRILSAEVEGNARSRSHATFVEYSVMHQGFQALGWLRVCIRWGTSHES
jgi:hypothetical protein